VPLNARTNTSTRLLRWIGDDIFLTSEDNAGQLLTRIGLAEGAPEDVTPQLDLQLEWLDVHPDGKLVVVSAVDAGQEDLWIADLGGTRARRLTDDAAFDRFPIWTGETVTFQSNRGGQTDLWQIDPATLRTRLVTSSEPTERPDSATDDGALITFQVNHDASRLWRTGDGRSAPVTHESLSDFAPSAARDGRMVVFQRQASSPALGATLLDSQLFAARTNAAGALTVAPVVTAGFLPAVSRGGGEVAYFTRSSSGSRFASLFVKDLTTAQVRQVSGQCALPGFSMYPLDWVHQTLAWSPDRSLYFIEQGDKGSIVRRFHSPDGTTTNVTGMLKTSVVDLYPSPDGDRLAYLLYHDRAFQLRERVVATGQERVVQTWPDRPAYEFQFRGWTNGGGLVVVRRVVGSGSDASLMEVFLLERGGTARLASVPGAHSATARLAPSGAELFFSSSEDAIHNIYAMTLPGGRIRKVTSNELPGRLFSGIAPLDDGSVVYAVNERRQDIWLSRAIADRSRR
jgi:Tol biopolymer transport system component